MRQRGARPGITAVMVLALLVLPVVDGVGDPPGHDVVSAVVRSAGVADGWHTGVLEAGDAVLVGVDVAAHPHVQVRSRHGERWTDWQDLAAPGDHAPDADRDEARSVRDVSEPVWIGAADAVEVRVPDGDGLPDALEAVETRGGDGLAWEPSAGDDVGAANALSVWPPMVPRSAWDPEGECRPAAEPDYAPSVERVYVHHTAIFPQYEPSEADDAVRAMCVFHVERRGFDDIGYNFLIDRYGRIYQGREGGVLRPVVGAHASGFNTGSAGIAIIGNFDDGPVPPAALDSLDRLTAWLFEWHGIDPYAVTTHVSTGGATTPHPQGEHVSLPTIVGHRQTATNTSCPGDQLFEHVQGADPAAHRVAERLRERGVEVGQPAPPPAPRVVPAPPDPPVVAAPTVTRVLESVVAAVRRLTSRRIDERIVAPVHPLGS